MTLRRTLLFLVACRTVLPLAGAGADPKPAGPTLTQQIDALLKQRLRPEPLPVELPNPFSVTGTGIREVGGEGRGRTSSGLDLTAANVTANPDREATAPGNADILAACAGKLKIGGIIRMKDQVQIVINDTPRKEGDFLTVPWNGTPVHLRIVRLLPDQLVLRYQDAELTVRY